MKYNVVFGTELKDLEETVQEYLADGWRPQGGIAVIAYGETETTFYQAMVRGQ